MGADDAVVEVQPVGVGVAADPGQGGPDRARRQHLRQLKDFGEDEAGADRRVEVGVVALRQRRGPVVSARELQVDVVLIVEPRGAEEGVGLLLAEVESDAASVLLRVGEGQEAGHDDPTPVGGHALARRVPDVAAQGRVQADVLRQAPIKLKEQVDVVLAAPRRRLGDAPVLEPGRAGRLGKGVVDDVPVGPEPGLQRDVRGELVPGERKPLHPALLVVALEFPHAPVGVGPERARAPGPVVALLVSVGIERVDVEGRGHEGERQHRIGRVVRQLRSEVGLFDGVVDLAVHVQVADLAGSPQVHGGPVQVAGRDDVAVLHAGERHPDVVRGAAPRQRHGVGLAEAGVVELAEVVVLGRVRAHLAVELNGLVDGVDRRAPAAEGRVEGLLGRLRRLRGVSVPRSEGGLKARSGRAVVRPSGQSRDPRAPAAGAPCPGWSAAGGRTGRWGALRERARRPEGDGRRRTERTRRN